ncbi:MAG: solute carrier family 23 protein [Thermodesulfobacteriota bacterium]
MAEQDERKSVPAPNDTGMIYGVDDVPPPGPLLALSVQQMLLLFTAATFPALLVREIGGDISLAGSMVALTMIAAGLGSILQGLRLPFMGSGYLCPNLCGPSYLHLSIQAAWTGGLPVMRGMIILAGLVEMALAPLIKRLRNLFPPCVVGMVVMMVGVSIIPLTVTNFFGAVYAGDELAYTDLIVGGISLFLMVALNVWGKGMFKMYCLLIGVAGGCLVSIILPTDFLQSLSLLKDKPFFDLPVHDLSLFTYDFDPGLLLPFLIVGLCGSLKSFGNFIAAQKISEPWRTELDMKPVSRGLMADGFTTVLAGFMGALAVDTSSSNVGLAGATRAVSRWISVVTGILFTALAFFPMVSYGIALIPRPVVGASLIFAASFMICTGLIQIMEEPLDQRKMFVVGLSIIFGLSTEFVPGMYAMFPEKLKPFFDSPLETTTVFGVVFYQLLHIDRSLQSFRRKKPKP